MTWVKLSKKKPLPDVPIITRSMAPDGKIDAIEAWNKWQDCFSSFIPKITHWWDGDFDFDLAVMEWYEKNN